ncbi:MAG: biopolymer transporter ExbD [Gammaproteobacteria bacterium]|nr:biopolymer transporter ExbD [Gammaproteobacteria bacterium]MDH5777658.1 biopolymer transporter ExbD [Gammaproteobacteria bacterium]
MSDSRRAKRMHRHHSRRGDRTASLNMVSLMDIFTILVFFLLVSAADSEILPTPKALKLPESTSSQRPKENIVIMVNEKNVMFQGKPIIKTAIASRQKSPVIAELVNILKELDLESRKQKNKKPASKRGVTIMGDKQTHYRVLKKIMLSCATANYSNISLAVVQKQVGQK